MTDSALVPIPYLVVELGSKLYLTVYVINFYITCMHKATYGVD